jgi:hypothetical protein
MKGNVGNHSCLGKMETISTWSQILVKMDHNNLKYFLNQKSLSSEQQKWVRKIQVFYFEILYKKGKENQVVDSLSRKEEGDATLCSISIVIPEWISNVQAEVCEKSRNQEVNQGS